MKVLIVADVLGEENNGTTVAAMNLIRFLKSKGDEVRVLCPDQTKKNVKEYFVVPEINLGFIINSILKKNNVALAKPEKSIIRAALEGVDVVHCIIPFVLSRKTTKIARTMGIPVTASFHCQAENITSHIFCTMRSNIISKIIYKNFYNKFYKNVNAIHYPTEFIKTVFEEAINRKTNGYVISNGVNDEFKKIDRIEKNYDDEFKILFIGRLSKEKSHKVLLKAISLSKYRNKIQLYLAGQGPRKNEIISYAKKLKIKQPIIDFLNRSELVALINQCDLYVHPSEVEIEAISCLEAIKCGLVPVISNSSKSATKKFALTEMNMFKCNDSTDLASKIDYWFENKDKRDKNAILYQNFANSFRQSYCINLLRNMILTYSKKENHTTKKIIYYKNEIEDDFANNGIKSIKTPADFKYVTKNQVWNFFSFVLYTIIAKPIVFLLNKIVYKQKIINHLKVNKKCLKGCFIYANHTLSMGDAYTPNIISCQKNNIIVGPEAISIPFVKTFVKLLNGMPIPSTFKGMAQFLEAISYKIVKGENITIYPEAHIWPYYTKIRNFSDASFRYPVELNVPSICLTNTFIKTKHGFRLVTHIDGPFFPNKKIDRKKAITDLRDKIYNKMNERSQEIQQYEKIKYINLNTIEEKDELN